MNNKLIKFLAVCFVTIFIHFKLQANTKPLVWHTDFNKAVALAQATNKPLMLFFTGSDWCGWCRKIQADIFKNGVFEKWAKENVVLVELDFPKRTKLDQKIQDQNNALQQQLGVRGYPTIFFVDQKQIKGKTQLSVLGSLGYEQGGATAWIKSAQQILQLRK